MSKKIGVLAVRFTAEDYALIKKISRKEGMCASAWIRRVVIEQLAKAGHKKKSKNHIMEYGR